MLIKELCRLAHAKNLPSVVVTFDPHPIEVLSPGAKVPRLTTIERKAELLDECGVDNVVVLNTNRPFLELDYKEFFDEYIAGHLKSACIVEGRNFFFGKDRRGNTTILQGLCHEKSIELSVVDIRTSDIGITSSSAIRKLISGGRIEEANALLIDDYQLEGRVVSGASRGRELGFPTANLEEISVLVPGEGVYAGRVFVDGMSLCSAIHIGPNPTFEEDDNKIEVHLIGQELSLYEKVIQVEFVKRIRDIRKFESQAELVDQIKDDVKAIEACLSGGV